MNKVLCVAVAGFGLAIGVVQFNSAATAQQAVYADVTASVRRLRSSPCVHQDFHDGVFCGFEGF